MDKITVGYIANTHGLKGEVKIKLQTDFASERFAKGARIYMERNESFEELEVVSSREQKGMMIVHFKGYNDINQVELWKGSRLVIEKASLPPLENDEIYYHDLMQMQVIDENGNALGEVVEIIESGAHAILRIQGEKELLLPYVKNFIKEVHLDTRKLIVQLLDGML